MSTEATPLPEGNGKPPGTTSWDGSVTELGTRMRSYYGRPVIKEPVWKPEVPLYFFTGGLGGSSSALGYVARTRGNDELADACSWIALLADTASPLLLISDLGRPERFYNMLRVFKVTSPMSVGSWILAFSGTTSGAAVAADLLGWKRLRNAAEAASALLGLPLSVYTATLVSNTAVPVWHDARDELPFLFAASSAASAGAAAAIAVPPAKAGPARRAAVGGTLAALALEQLMVKKLGFVGEPYEQDDAGRASKLAKGLTAAGAAMIGLGGRRSRLAAATGGALLLAGEVALRWSVYKAGFQSAKNPLYTVQPQRERADRDGTRVTTKPRNPAQGAG
jgi:formate-dependent nitrite reductase membrane component NrfD